MEIKKEVNIARIFIETEVEAVDILIYILYI